MPEFRFRIVRRFEDSLSRQVAESVRIDRRVEVLNSKTMFSRNRLPRLTLEKTEWEMKEELRKQAEEKFKEGNRWNKEKENENQEKESENVNENDEVDSNILRGEWRKEEKKDRIMKEKTQKKESQKVREGGNRKDGGRMKSMTGE
jgi:hypothetical protein